MMNIFKMRSGEPTTKQLIACVSDDDAFNTIIKAEKEHPGFEIWGEPKTR